MKLLTVAYPLDAIAILTRSPHQRPYQATRRYVSYAAASQPLVDAVATLGLFSPLVFVRCVGGNGEVGNRFATRKFRR